MKSIKALFLSLLLILGLCIQSIGQTDSIPFKKMEIKGFFTTWNQHKYSIVQAPLKKLDEIIVCFAWPDEKGNLSEQSEMAGRHRPEKRQVQKTQYRAKSFEREEERKYLLILRRSQSLKRRDGSWDQKWEEQRQAEETSQGRPWSLRPFLLKSQQTSHSGFGGGVFA